MAAIKTVLFDVGGVLLTNGWDHRERDVVLKHFEIDRDEFEQRHPEANDLWEKDRITVEQYLDRTVFYRPRNFTPAEFLQAMKDQSLLLENSAFGVLAQLAGSGQVRLGVLSNESRVLNAHRIDKFDLRKYFHFFFSSCYVGLRKPDPAIYKLALDVLQRDPAEVVFIDDRAENAGAAAAWGMKAIQYKAPENLRSELEQMGIRV